MCVSELGYSALAVMEVATTMLVVEIEGLLGDTRMLGGGDSVW